MNKSNATIKIVQEARLHGPDEYRVYTRVKSGDTFLQWKYWRCFDTLAEAQKEVKEIQKIREAHKNPKVVGYY